jgi:hypothetical protein
MSENKIRTVVRMKPERIESMDALLPQDSCKSRNEFICKAVDFYSGYLQTKQASGYLSQTLLSQMSGTLELMESRISHVIFKLAVELAISMNVTAAMADVDGETLRKLRTKCRDDVKKSSRLRSV